MNKQQFQELPDEEKMKMIYDLLDMVKDYSLVCFSAGWHRVPSTISIWDREKVNKFINAYGKESVKVGFVAARDNGIEKLTYVESVARTDFEKKLIRKNEATHQELKEVEKHTPYNFANDPDWQKLKNKMSVK